MTEYTEFKTICFETLNNVLFTYIEKGLYPAKIGNSNYESSIDRTRYDFLKNNFYVDLRNPKKQNADKRYQILYDIRYIESDRKFAPGVNRTVFFTVECLDKGNLTPNSQDRSDLSSYLSEIISVLDKIQFYQQTIDLITNKANNFTNSKLNRYYTIQKAEKFHLGAIKVDDSFKDVFNFSITFQLVKDI